MAIRKPLVLVSGIVSELSGSDSLDTTAPVGADIHYNYFKQGVSGVTLGQTVFVVTSYITAVNACWVFLNGSKLILTAGDYAETNATHITLASGLSANDELEVVSFEMATGSSVGIGESLAIAYAVAL